MNLQDLTKDKFLKDKFLKNKFLKNKFLKNKSIKDDVKPSFLKHLGFNKKETEKEKEKKKQRINDLINRNKDVKCTSKYCSYSNGTNKECNTNMLNVNKIDTTKRAFGQVHNVIHKGSEPSHINPYIKPKCMLRKEYETCRRLHNLETFTMMNNHNSLDNNMNTIIYLSIICILLLLVKYYILSKKSIKLKKH